MSPLTLFRKDGEGGERGEVEGGGNGRIILFLKTPERWKPRDLEKSSKIVKRILKVTTWDLFCILILTFNTITRSQDRFCLCLFVWLFSFVLGTSHTVSRF